MVILLTGTIDRVMSVLVAVVRAFDILHISMLVVATIMSETVLGLLLNIFLNSLMLCRPWWKSWMTSLSSTSVMVLWLAKYLLM